jgi:hypothetical protein
MYIHITKEPKFIVQGRVPQGQRHPSLHGRIYGVPWK